MCELCDRRNSELWLKLNELNNEPDKKRTPQLCDCGCDDECKDDCSCATAQKDETK